MKVVAPLIALHAIITAADAQNNSLIQSGEWSCYAATGGGNCTVPVIFPQPFGGVPSVSITYSSIPPVGTRVTVQQPIRSDGFTLSGTWPEWDPQGGVANLLDARKELPFGGSWIAIGPPPAPPPVMATVIPKYVVLAVVYAPPGSTNSRGNSQVTYTKMSSSGSTIETVQSFKQGYSIAFDSKGGIFAHADTGASFQSEQSVSNKEATEIKMTEMDSRMYSGDNTNAINHDNDVLFLWLNPQINLSIGTSAVEWGFADNTNPDIITPYVGWLKNPSQLPKGYSDKFKQYGITSADLTDIIARDPLVKDNTALSSDRFQKVLVNSGPIPYIPGESSGANPGSFRGQISTTNNSTVSTTKGDTYSMGLTVGFGAQASLILAKLSATLTNKDEWTWNTNKTNTTSNSITTSADVVIGGPGLPTQGPYTGPTQIQVYLDTYYNTFAFEFIK